MGSRIQKNKKIVYVRLRVNRKNISWTRKLLTQDNLIVVIHVCHLLARLSDYFDVFNLAIRKHGLNLAISFKMQ